MLTDLWNQFERSVNEPQVTEELRDLILRDINVGKALSLVCTLLELEVERRRRAITPSDSEPLENAFARVSGQEEIISKLREFTPGGRNA